MKAKNSVNPDELRPKYDFDYSKAVRGKYYKCELRVEFNRIDSSC